MPAAYPREFHQDVVAIARKGQMPIAQVAKDFRIHEMTLNKWMRKADIEDGTRPGATASESAALRDLRRRTLAHASTSARAYRLGRPGLSSAIPIGLGINGCIQPRRFRSAAARHPSRLTSSRP